eukprot:TRINITY_DN14457_c0_g4_i1.p1 TRINITY_DN14457_c0_g4~~TRINITY_DN14457_c0_g4_i1.p1  ORF type:complete len:566 (+),score=120.53 TRINITY_DN14457_c0_g4_i1:153-1700(+)
MSGGQSSPAAPRSPGRLEACSRAGPAAAVPREILLQHGPASPVRRTPPVVNSGRLVTRFLNPHPEWRDRNVSDLIRWQWGRSGAQKKDPAAEWVRANLPPAERPPTRESLRVPPPPGVVRTTWIGHATLLVQCAGLNVLTDPVFGSRCSPVPIGHQRVVPLPVRLEDLPPLHAITVSHNHYDHLCTSTVKRLIELGHKPRWYVPKGLEGWFVSTGIPERMVSSLTWWAEDSQLQVPGCASLKVTCAPAQHWSLRMGYDRNTSLWGSFVLDFLPHRTAEMSEDDARRCRVFVCGDTGYSRTMFRELGQAFAPVDVALIPIGAYCPRWFMRPQHIDPQEAVQLHLDLGSKRSIPMHWGTFVLSDEPLCEPPRLLRAAAASREIDPESFAAVRHGESVDVEARRDGEWGRSHVLGAPVVGSGHKWCDWGPGVKSCYGCGKRPIMNRGCATCGERMCELCFVNPFVHLDPAGQEKGVHRRQGYQAKAVEGREAGWMDVVVDRPPCCMDVPAASPTAKAG